MRANDAQGTPFDHKICQHRTARLERWQRNDFTVPNGYSVANKQGIAMPSYALWATTDFNRAICSMFKQQMVRDCA